MARPTGKTPIQRITTFSVTKWFVKSIKTLVAQIAEDYQERCEVLGGCIFTEGSSLAAATLALDFTGGTVMLNGRIKAALGSLSDTDFLDTSGDVGQPIYSYGSDASALSLSTDETAYITLIACNSDGAGGADDDDNGSALVIAVVNGTSSTYDAQTEHLTSREIQDALEDSSSVHDGVTAWCHIAQILFDENSGSPTTTIVVNRNNVVSQV